jgi:xylan 1,4-beta-xylosidase
LTLADILAQSVRAAPDVNAVATGNGREVDVLLWNYHDADLPAPPAEVELAVDGLHGSTTATEFRMDATHSNAYRVWQQMGSPPRPAGEQLRALQKAGGLEQTSPEHAIPLRENAAHIRLTIPRQGVILLRIKER